MFCSSIDKKLHLVGTLERLFLTILVLTSKVKVPET